MLLHSLRGIHCLWHETKPLTQAQAASLQQHSAKLGESWGRLGWRSTPWVHWTCAHATALASHHHGLHRFSSVPTEQRHKGFKRDLSHCFRGGSTRSPHCNPGALLHLQRMYAVDLGLLLAAADLWQQGPQTFWHHKQPPL